MKFFSKIRSKSRISDFPAAETYRDVTTGRHGPDLTANLPSKLLEHIFSHVSPHSFDHSLRSSEESLVDDTGCALCDLKDLAQCVLVCRRWNGPAKINL